MCTDITFKPLPNAVPEGTAAGDTFDLVCTFKLQKDGKVCLTQMGDVKAETPDKGKMTGRPDFKGYASSVQNSMSDGGA